MGVCAHTLIIIFVIKFYVLQCFECLGKQVKGAKVTQYFSDILTEMMLHEEKQDEMYIHNQPSH